MFNLKFTIPYTDRFVEMTVTASSAQDAELLGDVLADRMPAQYIPYTREEPYGWYCTANEVKP